MCIVEEEVVGLEDIVLLHMVDLKKVETHKKKNVYYNFLALGHIISTYSLDNLWKTTITATVEVR